MTNIAMRPAVRGLRLAALLAFAMSASACSTIASLDPTGLLSDDSGSASSSQTPPDLSTLPDKPKVQTPDDQKQVADSLAAEGTRAQYSADALHAGTETPAPPPPPASAVPPAASVEPVMPPSVQGADDNTSAPPPSSPAVSAETSAAPVAPAEAASPPPSAPGAQPAVPPNSGPGMAMAATVSPSDAQLGFKPSTAAPLNPSISKWVSAPVVAHYRRSAQAAGIAAGVQVADSSAVAASNPAVTYSGAAPVAEVHFRKGSALLDAAARADIRRAVRAYRAHGGQGNVRIVGHASGNAAVSEKHLMLAFKRSQARANAVAREIIREGVPAKKVLVDAVGDSQTAAYGAASAGNADSRRADIFLQD